MTLVQHLINILHFINLHPSSKILGWHIMLDMYKVENTQNVQIWNLSWQSNCCIHTKGRGCLSWFVLVALFCYLKIEQHWTARPPQTQTAGWVVHLVYFDDLVKQSSTKSVPNKFTLNSSIQLNSFFSGIPFRLCVKLVASCENLPFEGISLFWYRISPLRWSEWESKLWTSIFNCLLWWLCTSFWNLVFSVLISKPHHQFTPVSLISLPFSENHEGK